MRTRWMPLPLLLTVLSNTTCELPEFVPPEEVESCEMDASVECVGTYDPELIVTCVEGGTVHLDCHELCDPYPFVLCDYSSSSGHDVCYCDESGSETGGDTTNTGGSTDGGENPCPGLPTEFNGVLGGPCAPKHPGGIEFGQCEEDPTGRATLAHCDEDTCTWVGEACYPDKAVECVSCSGSENNENCIYSIAPPC